MDIPKVDKAIFGTRDDPLRISRQRNGEHIILKKKNYRTKQVKTTNTTRLTLCPAKSIVQGDDDDDDDGPAPPTPIFPSALPFTPETTALTSHPFNVLSKLPLTSPLPSGVNATLYTLSLCPRSCSSSCPVTTSQIRTTLSSDPAATYRESGEMATEVMPESRLDPTLSATADVPGPVVVVLLREGAEGEEGEGTVSTFVREVFCAAEEDERGEPDG